MASLYPNDIDVFTTKHDVVTGQESTTGDYVEAEHINSLQDSVMALEQTLGVNPQGSSFSVSDRIKSVENVKALKAPSICVFYGNPLTFNGASTVEAAANEFLYYDMVVLGSAREIPSHTDHQQFADLITYIKQSGSIKIFGSVDAGVSTSNLTLVQIEQRIEYWSDLGIDGIFLDNFGYDKLVPRSRQNDILDLVHGRGLSAFVRATNDLDVFADELNQNYNPVQVSSVINAHDYYLHESFAVNTVTGGPYIDTVISKAARLIANRKGSFGTKIVALATIGTDQTEANRQKYFNYAQAIALLYSYDGFYATTANFGTTSNSQFLYNSISIVGNYYDSNTQVIHPSTNAYYRIGSFGKISIDLSGHSYELDGIAIPGDSIFGTVNKDSLVDSVVDAINENPGAIINPEKIAELTADHIKDSVIEAVNDQINEGLTIDSGRIGNLSADKITTGNLAAERMSTYVIGAVNAYIGAATIDGAKIGSLTASHISSGDIDSDRIKTNVVDAINAYIGEAVISSAKIGVIDADKITTGDLGADRISANVVDAINAYIGTAKIDAAHIGIITAEQIQTNVIDAINAYVGEAVIDSAKIGNLEASKITSGDIDSNRLKANTIDAINAYLGDAHIDQARIGDISAEKITSGTLSVLGDMSIHGGDVSVTNTGLTVSGTGGILVTGDKGLRITSGTLVVDSNTRNVVRLGKLGFNNYGMILSMPSGASITINEDGISTSTGNFTIDSDGNVDIVGNITANSGLFAGRIESSQGWFGGVNGVIIDSTGLSIGSGGRIRLSDSEITTDKIDIKNNLGVSQVIIGKFGTQYGLFSGIVNGVPSTSLTSAGLRIEGSDAYINLAGGKFIVDGTTGRLEARLGVIGSCTIDNHSIKLGNSIDINGFTESITVGDHISMTSTGMAVSGGNGITVTGSRGIKISSGNLVIDESGTDIIILGQYDTGKYGLLLNTEGVDSPDIILDKSGLRATLQNGTNIFNIGSDGDVSIVGDVTANSGLIGGWSVTNNKITSQNSRIELNAAQEYILASDDVTPDDKYVKLSSQGLDIKGGAIRVFSRTSPNETIIDYDGINAKGIVAGDITADRMKTNIIDAVNSYLGSAKIQRTKIGELSADQITTGRLDTSNIIISTGATGTGARLDFGESGIEMYDAGNNNVVSISNGNGMIVHSPSGIKIDGGGSIRIGANDNIVISGTGIKAGTAPNYTNFFDASGIKTVSPDNSDKFIVINSGEVKLTTNNGVSWGTAITPDGFYGNLIINGTISTDKLDTTPPDIPTWRADGCSVISEEDENSRVPCLVVKWNQVSNEDIEGYKIYLMNEDQTSYYPVAVTGRTDEYRIRGLQTSKTYKVKVSSFDRIGNECSIVTPGDPTLSTAEKTVIIEPDGIAPAAPTNVLVTTGLKTIGVKWTPVTTNEDLSICYDLAKYRIEKANSLDNYATWATAGEISGNVFVDKDFITNEDGKTNFTISYKYRVYAVDTSNNESEYTMSQAINPSQVDSGDIVAGSILADHISASGLDAGSIKFGKMSGDRIDANTITAVHFDHELYGDITQALRYIQGQLNDVYFSWVGTNDSWHTGVASNISIIDDSLILNTADLWDSVNTWDNVSKTWDIPSVPFGSWESPIITLPGCTTVLNSFKYTLSKNGNVELTVKAKYAETDINGEPQWLDEYKELNAILITCKYVRFKIEITTSGDSGDYVRLNNFSFSFYHEVSNPVDETSLDTSRDKTVSNILAKRWEEHRNSVDNLATHGTSTVYTISTGGYNTTGDYSINDVDFINSSRDILNARDVTCTGDVSCGMIQVGTDATIRNNAGALELKNVDGTGYVDLKVNNLYTQGTAFIINSETVNIADNIITLNSDVSGTPTENAGIEIERGTSSNVSIRWNEDDDTWEATTDGSNYYRIIVEGEEFVTEVRGSMTIAGDLTVTGSLNGGSLNNILVQKVTISASSTYYRITHNIGHNNFTVQITASTPVRHFYYNRIDVNTLDICIDEAYTSDIEASVVLTLTN